MIDTLDALIVPNLAKAFGIFLLRQFFRTLPVELEEAARIDGASRLSVLFKIVLPLSGPALATLAVITFLWTWNDFLWPLITIYTPNNMTLQLGLTTFQGTHQSSHEPADGRQRDEHAAGAAAVLPRAALLHPRDRDVRTEGLEHGARSRSSNVTQGVPRRDVRARRPVAGDRRRRVPDPGRPVRLREDHRAAADRRPGEADRRARSRSATATSTTSRRGTGTSRWCSRTTRCTRT